MREIDILSLLPLALVAVTAVIAMLVAAFTRREGPVVSVTAAGLLLAFISIVCGSAQPAPVGTLLTVDGYARFFMGLFLLATLMVVAISFRRVGSPDSPRGEYYVLLTLAALGAMTLAASDHFASFALGLELLSVSLFALIAYRRSRETALEAGVKYLVLSGVSSSILLFGMALVYAQTGTLRLSGLGAAASGTMGGALMAAGLAGIVVGTGFKLSLVPFHLWAPDVYQGAPTPVAGFVATVSKGAVFVVLLRTARVIGIDSASALPTVIAVLATASMFAGNLLALRQDNLRRLLAYSSIAHMGYLLVMLRVPEVVGVEAAGYYLASYFLATLAAFGTLTALSGEDGRQECLADVQGLAFRRPWLCAVFVVALLSLAGLPLTAGFIGKFYLVLAGWSAGLHALVIVLIINSVIGLAYYLRVIGLLLQEPSVRRESVSQAPHLSWALSAALALLTAGTLLAGLFPDLLLRLTRLLQP